MSMFGAPIGDGCIDYGGCQCPPAWWGTRPPPCPVHNAYAMPPARTFATNKLEVVVGDFMDSDPPRRERRLSDADVDRIAKRLAKILKDGE